VGIIAGGMPNDESLPGRLIPPGRLKVCVGVLCSVTLAVWTLIELYMDPDELCPVPMFSETLVSSKTLAFAPEWLGRRILVSAPLKAGMSREEALCLALLILLGMLKLCTERVASIILDVGMSSEAELCSGKLLPGMPTLCAGRLD
jgi:hypothetical protein